MSSHERKLLTTEIAALKKKGKDVNTKISKAKPIDAEITALEKQVSECKEKARYCLM